MARFLKSPQQNIVPMYQPQNIDFYAGILNKAQQDLERSTAIKAAAIEKYGDLEFSSKEDMDAVVGRAQEMLKGATDADFVSPSKVTNAVLQANREVMPGVQAVKAKAKAADMYDRMRVQYGPNFWGGTDPRTQSILDKSTGEYVDPNQFKAVGINAEEVDKLLLASQQQELNYSYETPVKSDLPGYLKINKYTGLADDRREELYAPGTASAIAIAKSQLATMPQLKEVFGSEEAALTRLMERNYQTTGNYKQSVDSQYITDIMGAEARAAAEKTDSYPIPPVTQPIEGDAAQNTFISDALSYLIGDKDIKMSPKEITFDESGKISKQSAPGQIAVTNPYGQVEGYKNPSKQSQISAHAKSIAQNKLITGMRKSLQEQGMNIIQDPKTGKTRSRTDKEVYEFYTQAVNNTANTFGKNFEVTPGIEIASSNPFIDSQGKFKDFRNANIELYVDGEWKSVDKDELAKNMGFDMSNQKDVTAFSGTLKDISSRVLDFSSGEAKQRASINTTKGNLSLRYNAPPKVKEFKKPVSELISAFYAPTKKEINLGGNFYAQVESTIRLNEEGNPILIPQIVGFKGGSPEIVDAYTKLYLRGEALSPGQGYQAIIDEMQEQTDAYLVGSGAVFKENTFQLPIQK